MKMLRATIRPEKELDVVLARRGRGISGSDQVPCLWTQGTRSIKVGSVHYYEELPKLVLLMVLEGRDVEQAVRVIPVPTIEETAALLDLLREPARTAFFLVVLTGLRVGELLALKWSDIDFEKLQISVTRSIVMQHLGECKTEASRKPVPLDPRLAESLYNWRRSSPYPRSEDWVFASPHSNGKLPYWPGAFYRAHILPAAKKLGIDGIGWHTFRRTYATFLKANGEDVKTVQELLRHANSPVTMNLYAQAITQNKRDAQSRIVTMVLDDNRLRKAQPSQGASPYRTITDLQISGRDFEVAQSIGVPDGI